MIQTSIQFNGTVTLTLKGTSEEERLLLALAFTGKAIATINSKQDSFILTLKPNEEGK